jgi:hypothetical protein
MPSNAVTLALASEARAATNAADVPPGAGLGRPRQARALRPSRSHLFALVVAVLAVWLVLVFGRSLTELNEATERAAALGAETAALQARLDAGQRELELVQTDAFQALQARAYGLGGNGERAFALEAGAPPPPIVVPLGGESPTSVRTPLESWLSLLFGGP